MGFASLADAVCDRLVSLCHPCRAGAIVRWKGRELGHTPLRQCVLPSGDQVVEITAPGISTLPDRAHHPDRFRR